MRKEEKRRVHSFFFVCVCCCCRRVRLCVCVCVVNAASSPHVWCLHFSLVSFTSFLFL